MKTGLEQLWRILARRCGRIAGRLEESGPSARSLKRRREKGAALFAVLVMIAVIGSTVVDFAYNARIEYASASGARDELRAHYLSRSALNLAKLLLRVQQNMLDPNLQQLKMDMQIADYAPYLIAAFNSKESAEGLASFLGIDTSKIKGVGVDVGSFDLEMDSLDGRININCGGGPNAGAPAVMRTAASLAAMMLPQRYNPLFERADKYGQYHDRLSMMRAIIDWADQDLQMFGSSAPEDYGYDRGNEKYYARNHYYDTLSELRLVRGVNDEFMRAFADQLTVYGGCQVNLNLADIPTIMALVTQYAANPADRGLEPTNLTLLAHYLIKIRDFSGGFQAVKQFTDAVQNPMPALNVAFAIDNLVGGKTQQTNSSLPPVMGIALNSKISEAVVGSSPRRVWRLRGKSEAGRVKKTITAIWDQQLISAQATPDAVGPGGFVYWRED